MPTKKETRIEVDLFNCFDLFELTETILPPNEEYLVKGSYFHDFDFKINTGVLGKTLPQLLVSIGNAYDKEARKRPTIKWEDNKLGSGEVPFWGDHVYLEGMIIDTKTKEIELHFGS